jgi:hypothetical protein
MKEFNMPEPTTSAAAGAGWLAKVGWAPIVAGLFGIAIALYAARPQTKPEWILCVLTAGSFSIYGAPALIEWLGFQAWPEQARAFFYLLTGTFAWLLLRPIFLWFQRRANKDIGQQAKEVKELIKKG